MFNDIKERLEGCIYTIFTPFNDDHSIDYSSLERYLHHIYRTGGRKFYAMAYNSRYSQLTHKEIMELNAFCIREVKKLNKNNIVIVGDPIHCSTAETIEFTRHAKEEGADLISLLVREKYFSDEQILEHYAEVGRVTEMGILVHEMPFLSGADGTQIHWPKSLFQSLPKIPQIVALKEDAKDFEMTCVALELEPKIRIVIAGRKSVFMDYKPYGAKAYLNGISMIDARIGEAFWKAYKSNDKTSLDFILKNIEGPFFDECAAKYGWHRTNKALLQAAGLMHRRDRMPMPHLNEDEFLEIDAVYKKTISAVEEFFAK
ncbi:dihydrodipicolinate synthase family protein [Kiloniella antarctica]|uniref:Dihydrodipicolinate synthase family protein n=1 Tax=Kiloniella antarctica TaxID=1550907 RepID=A0ABW5BT07_9PROT